VAGKGLPAALFMALSRAILRSTTLNGHSPAQALLQANDLLIRDNRSNLFLTAFYSLLDTKSGHLVYARAGHLPPLHLRADSGQFEELTTEGTILGAFSDAWLENCETIVAPGDYLVAVTDGVTEAMNGQQIQYGDERLRTTVQAHAGDSAREMLKAVVKDVHSFTRNEPQSDDLTVCIIRRTPLVSQ
jgi:sigma-B regulation protein RsbU (phosphoserine phosphatase)